MAKLRIGSEHKERQAIWALLYADILRELDGISNAHTLVPMGDGGAPGKLDAATFTGLRYHASGLEPIWTPSSTLDSAAWAIEYQGEGRIPILTFGGAAEQMDTPDAAFWSMVGAMALGVWVNMKDATSSAIFGKWDATATADREWRLYLDSGDKPTFAVYDEGNSAQLGRQDATALVQDVWNHIIVSFDGGTASSGIKVYLNSVLVDDTDVNAGSGFANQVAGAEKPLIGSVNNSSEIDFFDGKMAGGPLAPWLVQGDPTVEQVVNIYRRQRAALGV